MLKNLNTTYRSNFSFGKIFSDFAFFRLVKFWFMLYRLNGLILPLSTSDKKSLYAYLCFEGEVDLIFFISLIFASVISA